MRTLWLWDAASQILRQSMEKSLWGVDLRTGGWHCWPWGKGSPQGSRSFTCSHFGCPVQRLIQRKKVGDEEEHSFWFILHINAHQMVDIPQPVTTCHSLPMGLASAQCNCGTWNHMGPVYCLARHSFVVQVGLWASTWSSNITRKSGGRESSATLWKYVEVSSSEFFLNNMSWCRILKWEGKPCDLPLGSRPWAHDRRGHTTGHSANIQSYWQRLRRVAKALTTDWAIVSRLASVIVLSVWLNWSP